MSLSCLSVRLSATGSVGPVLVEIGPNFFWGMLIILAQHSRAKFLNFDFVPKIWVNLCFAVKSEMEEEAQIFVNRHV